MLADQRDFPLIQFAEIEGDEQSIVRMPNRWRSHSWSSPC
jgi:hypothetical protein